MTELELAEMRAVLAKRTPNSECWIRRNNLDIVVEVDDTVFVRTRLRLIDGSPGIQETYENLDALRLAWNVFPELLDEIDRLRAALAWYADSEHYADGGWHGEPMHEVAVLKDAGQRARAALGQQGEEQEHD